MIDLEVENDLEKILSQLNWKMFEKAVAQVFEANGFSVQNNFRFKTKRRYEMDIIASRHKTVVCTDCKKWRRGRYKQTSLRNAAKMQKKRTKQFEKFVMNNPIAKHKLKISNDSEFHPAIVTLFEEELKNEDGVIVVPVWKLNSFLNNEF